MTDSIRGKIRLGYYALATVVLAFALFAYADLRWLDHRIAEGAAVDDFQESTLEMRRHEKNFFLYHEAADLDDAVRHSAAARDRLAGERTAFADLAPLGELDALKAQLADYAALLARYGGAGPASEAAADLQGRIRRTGHAISATAAALGQRERAVLTEATQQARTALLVSVAVVALLAAALGRILAHTVVRPLRLVESALRPIGEGRFGEVRIGSRDREIVSLVAALNRMLDELRARHQQLLRSEKLASLGTLVSGVAHELNNPLSNISTSCQLLEEEVAGSATELERDLLAQIDAETLRARDIVRGLLDFARDRELAIRSLALRPLVEQAARFVSGQKPAEVVLRIDVPDDVRVQADAHRLRQALLNLLKNAIEAVGERGEVRVRASHRRTDAAPADGTSAGAVDYRGVCDSAPEVVDIEVQDTGPGIASEVLPRVFDPFFTTKDVGKGSGLGLAIAHGIVEQHGGCIAVRSVPGHGSTFFIRLPYRPEASPPAEGNR